MLVGSHSFVTLTMGMVNGRAVIFSPHRAVTIRESDGKPSETWPLGDPHANLYLAALSFARLAFAHHSKILNHPNKVTPTMMKSPGDLRMPPARSRSPRTPFSTSCPSKQVMAITNERLRTPAPHTQEKRRPTSRPPTLQMPERLTS